MDAPRLCGRLDGQLIMGTYQTLDAYVAGYLALGGVEPRLVADDRRGKIAFVFDRTEAVSELLAEYNAGGAVCAHEYAAAIKRLKGRIHDYRKGGDLGNGK